MTIEYTVVDTTKGLEALVEHCLGMKMVTIDTEFVRTSTYYPKVGLIQVFDGTTCSLVDPLAVDDLGPLNWLLQAPDVLKVFHACSEDLEVFHHLFGIVPAPLFDTQIAAAMLGLGFSMSYSNLVAHCLDKHLPKEETRSDWLARPLSDAQLEYAALDVIDLFDVYRQLVQQLTEAGRLSWAESECAKLGDEIAINIPPEEFYKRIKSAGRLKPRELNRLRALCGWREVKSRELDVPRNRVIEEKTLVAVARDNLNNREALRQADGMSPRQMRKFGEDILDVLDRCAHDNDADFPSSLDLARVNNDAVKQLRKVVNDRAERFNIAPELLAKRKQLEALVRQVEQGDVNLPAELDGWRREIVGDALLGALTGDAR